MPNKHELIEYTEQERAKDTGILHQMLVQFYEALYPDGLSTALEVIAEDVVGSGLGDQGYYTNKDGLRKLFEASYKNQGRVEAKAALKSENVDIRIYPPNVATINADVYVTTGVGEAAATAGVKQFAAARKENGRWLFTAVSAAPLIMTAEAIEAYPLTFADKTLYQLKGELKSETYEMVSESFAGGIICTYARDRHPLKFANDALIKMFGYEKEEFYEKFKDDTLQLNYVEDGEFTRSLTAQDMKDRERNIEGRVRWLKKDGSYIWTEHRVRKTKDENGNDIFLGVIIDVNELVNLQLKTEEQRLAIIEAEALSAAKSAFLAQMSHEIRTPMNSIVGFSELALDGEISPKTKGYLGKILENSHWLLQIINDILDISKIESGKMELENIPFDIHDLFTSCQTLIIPKAIEKGILLHFYAEPSLDKMPLGDPTRLRQALVNLLSNAVKFTNSGIVKLLAEIKEKDEKTITMRFEVRDSGIGMTPEQIKKIFNPFMQAETGTTRKYGGTGLGLAITKNIVELMGGKLMVESTPNVGSKFSFELCFDTIDISDENIDKKIVFDEFEKPTFVGEILLCEDNIMNQQVICEHLARVGIKTVIADNGRIGVEMIKNRMAEGKKQFDLIFMDIHMPVMDGLEASAKIIELDTGIPIVAMTANIMSNDREIYKACGMSDCVGKPFTSQELWRCLMKFFTPISWQPVNGTVQEKAEDELKRKLIAQFVKNNRMKFNEIAAAIDSGDIKLAHRLVHTLKSNAGQLKKTALQQIAAEMESCLADGKNMTTPKQMEILETELNAMLAELEPLVHKPSASDAGVTPLTAVEVRELFEKLEPMLANINPECINMLDDLRAVPETEELVHQIESYEFESAAETLAELKDKLREFLA